MDLSSTQGLDDLLTEFPQLDCFDCQFRICTNQANYVTDFRGGIEAKQEVGSGEFEEVHAMALDDLSHVHQLAEQAGRAGRSLTRQRVTSFGRGKMVADRADSANARGDLRHFKVEAAFAKFFKSTKFVDVHIGAADSPIILHVDGDLGVPFDTGNGFNGNFLWHSTSPLLLPVQQFIFEFGLTSLRQLGEDIEDRVCLGRATGNVEVYGDNFMNGTRLGHGCQFRVIRDLAARFVAFGFDVGAFERCFHAAEVPHGWYTTEHRAVSKCHKDSGTFAHLMSNLFIGAVVDAPFEYANIHAAFIRLFQISDGSGAQVGELDKFQNAFIHVEQGHVTACAATDPIGS